jgi:septum formation protein
VSHPVAMKKQRNNSDNKPPVLLASSSVYRRALMDQLQIPYLHASPQVDETLLKKTAPVSLPDLPLYLAEQKARSLIEQNLEGITIGSDQMAILNNQMLDKPGTRERAIEQLLLLQGKTHQLVTAIAVHKKGQWERANIITELRMKTLTRRQIESYVDKENPLDCAGAYKIEKLGIVLFDDINTSDPSAIVGLPLIALSKILEKLGIPLLP